MTGIECVAKTDPVKAGSLASSMLELSTSESNWRANPYQLFDRW